MVTVFLTEAAVSLLLGTGTNKTAAH